MPPRARPRGSHMAKRTSCASDKPGEKGGVGRNVDCETNHFMTVLYVRTSSFPFGFGGSECCESVFRRRCCASEGICGAIAGAPRRGVLCREFAVVC